MSEDRPQAGQGDPSGEGWQPPAGAAQGGYPPGAQPGEGQAGGWQAGPAGPYGYGAPPTHPSAGTVLVLGVLGLVVCGIVAPFAWVKGNAALREIEAQPGRWSGRDQVQVGRVLGIIGSVLLGLAVLVLVGMLALFVVGSLAVVGTSGF